MSITKTERKEKSFESLSSVNPIKLKTVKHANREEYYNIKVFFNSYKAFLIKRPDVQSVSRI